MVMGQRVGFPRPLSEDSEMLAPRILGKSGPVVSAIGLGSWSMFGTMSPADEAELVATIHEALERGVTFFDTAEYYGPHTAEMLLGRALEGRREKAVIATKFGFVFQGSDVTGLNSRPEHIRSVVEGSLK